MTALPVARRAPLGVVLLAALVAGACTTVPMRDRDSGEDGTSAIDVQGRDSQQPPDDQQPPVDQQTPPGDVPDPMDAGVAAMDTGTGDDTGVAAMDTGVDVRSATDTGVDVRTDTGVDVRTVTDTGIDVRPVTDTGVDVRSDTGVDVRSDTGVDTGVDTSAPCPFGQTRCSGVCVDVNTNESNCGRCGAVCPFGPNSRPVCSAGRCSITCARNYDDCNMMAADGCEASLLTSPNCGSCGTLCLRFQVCTSGGCASCMTGLVACSNACVNTLTDVNNCGGCGYVCPTPPAGLGPARCTNGRCYHGVTCDPQRADCDRDGINGYEINTDTSSSNCGACGTVCPVGTACCNGACRSTVLLCPRC